MVVVVAAPVLDEHPGLGQAGEQLDVASNSSRTRPPTESTYAFCHGEPGSM